MKILHVSLGLPPYRTGGLTRYSVDLMVNQVSLSHRVGLLYPGHFKFGGKSQIISNGMYKGIDVYEIVNPQPVSLLGGIKNAERFLRQASRSTYINFLNHYKPDIIHIHTLMGIHKELLEAARELGIKMVFTSHDYFGICPKVNLMDWTGNLCDDYENGLKCIKCNQHGYSMLKITIMQSKIYRELKYNPLMSKIRAKQVDKQKVVVNRGLEEKVNSSDASLADSYVKLRHYYNEMLSLVNTFHFNSTVAQREYEKYIAPKGKVISITHQNIQDSREVKNYTDHTKPLYVSYLGPVDQYKGFYMLLHALEQLKDRDDWKLRVYGDVEPTGIQYDADKVHFFGKYQHHQLNEIFKETDLLIIPSIWKETFGFIGLEALSHGVPALVTDCVGFKDLIQDGVTGMVCKPNSEDLAKHLTSVLDHRETLVQMNRNIVSSDFNFSMSWHTTAIIDLYKSTMLDTGDIVEEGRIEHEPIQC
ncbi:glycosyltransferase [Paenibacillus enshidis]|uniref:Glycosyltransferase n=1 Tax=Paenibacillus enshidis TaxID=1458439 RepID=A0ABV5AUL7_9BACL